MVTRWTNRHEIPAALADAIVADEKRQVGRYSVTQLLAPPRIRRLLEQNDVEVDVADRLWAMVGKGVHAVLDGHGTGETETQIAAELDGVWLSGTIDASEDTSDGVILRDWKVTSVTTWRAGGREEWEQQLNLYSWLMQRGSLQVESRPGGAARFRRHQRRTPSALLVTMVFRDWSAPRAGRSGDDEYPPAACATIELPRWEADHAEEFLRTRLALHLAANEVHLPDMPPLCSDTERWHRPGAWAVMKQGNKRALRLLPTKRDATAWAEHKGVGGLYLEERPGVDVRCEDYCAARSVCPHALSTKQPDPKPEPEPMTR